MDLLDDFVDEILGFHMDKNEDVREFIIEFMEKICKKDNKMLPIVAACMKMLMYDEMIYIRKQVIKIMCQLYRNTLMWLCSAQKITDVMESTWNIMLDIKTIICSMLEYSNDGLQMSVLKFMESVIVLQTYVEEGSLKSTKMDIFNLDNVPLTLTIVRHRQLMDDAMSLFDRMVQYQSSADLTVVLLGTCMASLTHLALKRPQFMKRVITSMEILEASLPLSFIKSDENSVCKTLQLKLFTLLRHEASEPYQNNLTTLLANLGVPKPLVIKCIPKRSGSTLKKRPLPLSLYGTVEDIKRPKIGLHEYNSEDIIKHNTSCNTKLPPVPLTVSALSQNNYELNVNAIEKQLSLKLPQQSVPVSVMNSLLQLLPTNIPPRYIATCTPMAGPGTEQLCDDNVASTAGISGICSGIDGSLLFKNQQENLWTPPLQPPATKLKTKSVNLFEMTKALSTIELGQLQSNAIDRILKSEKIAIDAGITAVRMQIISRLATRLHAGMKKKVSDFIFKNLASRSELLISWLYEEYAYMKGFVPRMVKIAEGENGYGTLLCQSIKRLMCLPDGKDRDQLLTRLYIETPSLPEEAISMLRGLALHERNYDAGIAIPLMMEVLKRRPPVRNAVVFILLEFTAHQNSEFRERSLTAVVELYGRANLCNLIDGYNLMYVRFLINTVSPAVLYGEERGRPIVSTYWTNDSIRACLYLFMSLLPINEGLIYDLIVIYVEASSKIKRKILVMMEMSIKSMGNNSNHLMQMIETCPEGSETFVLKIIYILTDHVLPSTMLVNAVRKLIRRTGVIDIRFVIPIISGLEKEEVVEVLPILIKKTHTVILETFHRLWGTNVIATHHEAYALSPGELLLELHKIEHDSVNVVNATLLCFSQKELYTQEVLSLVIQQLMEVNPIPTLLMRTVIQSVTLYPQLIGLVMNILQRLILKRVWINRKLWQGFIRCCRVTQPRSLQVLLQLPLAELEHVLITNCDFRQPLYLYVQTLTTAQRYHISHPMLQLIGFPCEPRPSGSTEKKQIDKKDKLIPPLSPKQDLQNSKPGKSADSQPYVDQ